MITCSATFCQKVYDTVRVLRLSAMALLLVFTAGLCGAQKVSYESEQLADLVWQKSQPGFAQVGSKYFKMLNGSGDAQANVLSAGMTAFSKAAFAPQDAGGGQLQVNLFPDLAVSDGAQWSIDEGASWNDSRALLSDLPENYYWITYKPVAGWAPPPTESVYVIDGEQLTHSATYTQLTGSIQITITPEEAVLDGAQWSIDGTTWNDSGTTLSGVIPGIYSVTFSDVLGFEAPQPLSVDVVVGQTASATGVYTVVPMGRVQCTILPVEAVLAGAQWGVGDGIWRDSDAIVSVPVGNTKVSFRPIFGWTAPEAQDITVVEDQLTSVSGTYVPGGSTGSVTVTIDPPEVLAENAQWRIGDGDWMNSGAVVEGLAPGTYPVSYKDVDWWVKPATENVTVVVDQVTETSGTYKFVTGGAVQVTVLPDTMTSKGAQWTVDGGTTWYNSQDVAMDVPVGPQTVTFKDVNGWATPANIPVDVAYHAVSETSGTYVKIPVPVCVTLAPAEAVAAGAKWRVDNGVWRDSGTTVALDSGNHILSFNTVPGWMQPDTQILVVPEGGPVQLTATYKSSSVYYGSLQVNLTDMGAPLSFGRWKVGNYPWQVSGAKLVGLTPGDYSVTFMDLPGYVTPPATTVTLAVQKLTVLNMEYFDLDMSDADFTKGVESALMPGNLLDFSWSIAATHTTDRGFWCEVFASKTGGFDQIRFGSSVTNSHYQKGLSAQSQVLNPQDQVLKSLPDGIYSLMPMVNRPSISGALPEQGYVNNWMTVAGKRLRIRNEALGNVDFVVTDAAFAFNPTNPDDVTVSGTLQNAGFTTGPKCWVETFYGSLTPEGLLDSNGTIGSGMLIPELAPGESMPFVLSGTVPGVAENFAYAVVADSTDIVPESNEVNNGWLWCEPWVVPVPPVNDIDLAVTSMTIGAAQLAPNQVAPGDLFDCAVTVRNNGQTTVTGCWLEVFGSQDGGVSVVRGSGLVDGLYITPPAPGEEETYSFSGVAIKALGDGMYTPVAVINRSGVRGNPGDSVPFDNVYKYWEGRVSINTPVPASTVNIAWSEGPFFNQVGNTLEVTGKMVNQGATDSKPFWTEAFAGVMDPKTGMFVRGAALAGGVYCDGLAAGAELDIAVSGEVTSGTVVGVLADSTDLVAETDETDNYDYSEPMN